MTHICRSAAHAPVPMVGFAGALLLLILSACSSEAPAPGAEEAEQNRAGRTAPAAAPGGAMDGREARKVPPADASERRCGWIDNPTPGNWWLVDRDGEWLIGAQGGYQAPGLDEFPDLTERDWTVTGGSSYGYGCACLDAKVDARAKRIARIERIEQKPLRACRADPALPRR